MIQFVHLNLWNETYHILIRSLLFLNGLGIEDSKWSNFAVADITCYVMPLDLAPDYFRSVSLKMNPIKK